MREILFRGKRKDNGEWVEGDLIHLPNGISILANGYAYVIPETVGQYTGLTDKNGKKIFEGDIVKLIKWSNLYFKISYEGCQWYLVNSKNVKCFCLSIYKIDNIEVIGNIHDNGELLKIEVEKETSEQFEDCLLAERKARLNK